MTEYSTPIYNESLPLSAQEIRSAALQAASRCRPPGVVLQAGDLIDVAQQFAVYIERGLEPSPAADQPSPINVFVTNVKSTLDRCGCDKCRTAARLLDELVDPAPVQKPFMKPLPRIVPLPGCTCQQCAGVPASPVTEAAPDDTDAPDPLPASDTLRADLAERIARANEETNASLHPLWNPDADAAIAVFKERIGALPSSSTVVDVYVHLFGDAK